MRDSLSTFIFALRNRLGALPGCGSLIPNSKNIVSVSSDRTSRLPPQCKK